MCGFAGFLSFGGSSLDAAQRQQVLASMGAAIAHRGPDDAQYYDDGTLALVFRRLSIIDIEGGRQPLFNESGDLLAVVNGEIYNHNELRAQLQPRHTFASRSDSETALHAYEEWGPSSFARLTGMFALGLWDVRAQRLTLARDRLGIKPLYLCRLPSGVLFGSELKALLAHPQCPRSIAWSFVDRPATHQNPHYSYVEGVELAAGGEVVEIDAHGLKRHRYWQLADHLATAPFGDDAQRYADTYAELLGQVTAEHLQRDVGAALHLSGGVDSSLLAAIIARTERDLPCLTVVERSNHLGGDVEAARQVAARLGMPWCPVRFDYRQIADDMAFGLSHFERLVWMMDSPRFNLEWAFKNELHRLSKARYPGTKVVLLGQGADEFAGGYSNPLHAQRADWLDYLRRDVASHLAVNRAAQQQMPAELWGLLNGRTQGKLSPYHQMMLLMVPQLQHHNLWHEDRTSAWNGLEARVPFLDHRLVELLASVPAALHEELFWDKAIVRRALERYLPNHPVRQPKLAFLDSHDNDSQEVLMHNLLGGIVGEFRDKYLHDDRSLFQADKVEVLIEQAIGRGPQSREATTRLMRCITLAIFERQCAESQPAMHRSSGHAPVLDLVGDADWAEWDAAMAPKPKCTRAWEIDERVMLRDGARVLTPVHETGHFCFVVSGSVAGEINSPARGSWVSTFLRNIGTAPVKDFTVGDWLDEFDIELDQFAELLNVLHHQGVLKSVPVTPARTATGSTGSAQVREPGPPTARTTQTTR